MSDGMQAFIVTAALLIIMGLLLVVLSDGAMDRVKQIENKRIECETKGGYYMENLRRVGKSTTSHSGSACSFKRGLI